MIIRYVYVVVIDWATEFESDFNIRIYDNEQAAINFLEEYIDNEKESSWYNELSNRIEDRTKRSWECYEDGDWVCNHSSIYIRKELVR